MEEQNKKELMPEQEAPATPAGTGKKKRLPLIALLAAALICAFAWYYWNLPEQRTARALKAADERMQEQDYEAAAAGYAQALAIDSGNAQAMTGHAQALLLLGDQSAKEEGLAERALGCALYEEVIAFCQECLQGGAEDAAAQELEKTAGTAEDRLRDLRSQIAASYDSVECVISREDRSGKVFLAEGREIPYTWYYDLVRIEDPYYPLADRINAELAAGADAFFAGDRTNPSAGISGDLRDPDGSYFDYVGVTDTYSGKGLLSIRMAEIRVTGKARAGYFCGVTYRLADGKRLTLEDVTGRTDDGLRHLVNRRIREWMEQEGYASVSMKDVEEYVEETDPADFNFYVDGEGKVFLVLDQSCSFFAANSELLEIPLE